MGSGEHPLAALLAPYQLPRVPMPATPPTPPQTQAPWMRSGPVGACIGIQLDDRSGACGCDTSRIERARQHLRADTGRWEPAREELLRVYSDYVTGGPCDVPVYALERGLFNAISPNRGFSEVLGRYMPPAELMREEERRRFEPLGLSHAIVVPHDAEYATVFHELVHGYSHQALFGDFRRDVQGRPPEISAAPTEPELPSETIEGLTEFLTVFRRVPREHFTRPVATLGVPQPRQHPYQAQVTQLCGENLSVDLAARVVFRGEIRAFNDHRAEQAALRARTRAAPPGPPAAERAPSGFELADD